MSETVLLADPVYREHLAGREHPERPGRFDAVMDGLRAAGLLQRLGAEQDRVILMPEGTDREGVGERSIWVAEICKREGYRFSPRLHVDLWGNRRGV